MKCREGEHEKSRMLGGVVMPFVGRQLPLAILHKHCEDK